ncbi:MAG: hypothetical protein AB7N54_20050 [Alphaproteobacteria bacterium]
MARPRRDTGTLDLLAWAPPQIDARFDPSRVRAHSDRVRMARAIAEAIKESSKSRDAIHAAMVEHLGRDFGRHAFDRCTAPSAENEFSVSKLIAFLAAVPDLRVVNALLEGTEFVAIPRQYLGAVEEAICADQLEALEARRKAARRQWKGGAR